MTKKGQQMLTPAKIACSKLWIETPLLENGILARVETKEIFKYIKSKFENLLMARVSVSYKTKIHREIIF
jgi:hypothetical protein